MDLGIGVRLRLGASACLLGRPVRYDGEHRLDPWIADRLGAFTDWAVVCPEEEAGLGVPRPPVRLVRSGPSAVGVMEPSTGRDLTAVLDDFSERRIAALGIESLDGFVLKSRSPSCGIGGIPVHRNDTVVDHDRGRFARALARRDPLLPLIDEADFAVPERRRHFLERAQVRSRTRRFDWVHGDVERFLASHDQLLLCREHPPLRAPDGREPSLLSTSLRAAMATPPTTHGHVRALSTALEHLEGVDAGERWGLCVMIDQYEQGALDVEVCRQFARALACRGGDAWLRSQHFLDPFPAERRHAPGRGCLHAADRARA